MLLLLLLFLKLKQQGLLDLVPEILLQRFQMPHRGFGMHLETLLLSHHSWALDAVGLDAYSLQDLVYFV